MVTAPVRAAVFKHISDFVHAAFACFRKPSKLAWELASACGLAPQALPDVVEHLWFEPVATKLFTGRLFGHATFEVAPRPVQQLRS